jgi:hypothetical protein
MRTTNQNPSLFQSQQFLLHNDKPSSSCKNMKKFSKIHQLNLPFLKNLLLPENNEKKIDTPTTPTPTPKTYPRGNNKYEKEKNLIKSCPTKNFKIFNSKEKGKANNFL